MHSSPGSKLMAWVHIDSRQGYQVSKWPFQTFYLVASRMNSLMHFTTYPCFRSSTYRGALRAFLLLISYHHLSSPNYGWNLFFVCWPLTQSARWLIIKWHPTCLDFSRYFVFYLMMVLLQVCRRFSAVFQLVCRSSWSSENCCQRDWRCPWEHIITIHFFARMTGESK